MDVIASRVNSVQWLVHDCELAPSAEHAWNKERVPGARNSYWITARGYSGVEQRTKTETEREQTNCGEFPKTLTPSRASISRIPLNSNTNSLYLSLNTFSLRPTVLNQTPVSHAFLSFFFLAVQQLYNIVHFSSPVYEANILVTKYHQIILFTIYIEIWQITHYLYSFWSSNLQSTLFICTRRRRISTICTSGAAFERFYYTSSGCMFSIYCIYFCIVVKQYTFDQSFFFFSKVVLVCVLCRRLKRVKSPIISTYAWRLLLR